MALRENTEVMETLFPHQRTRGREVGEALRWQVAGGAMTPRMPRHWTGFGGGTRVSEEAFFGVHQGARNLGGKVTP